MGSSLLLFALALAFAFALSALFRLVLAEFFDEGLKRFFVFDAFRNVNFKNMRVLSQKIGKFGKR